ncbi:MAG: GtrA family protein [Arcanobacterium sp.]|nr:GtrA family protein [Arcanobacterium sp.]
MSEKNTALKQAILFTLFSLTAAVVEVISFALCLWLAKTGFIIDLFGLPENWWTANPNATQQAAAATVAAWSQGISLFLSVVWNFSINRKFTFKSANNIPIAMLKVALFYVFFIPASSWWTGIFVSMGWNEAVVKVGTMIVNFIGEFLWWKFIVFREPKQK